MIGVQVAEQNKNAAKLRGEGQKLELEEVAQGQRAQADVLGQDRVLTITLVQQLLKTIQDKPEVVSLIGKLVPQAVVSTGGQSAGLDSAAAIIGALRARGLSRGRLWQHGKNVSTLILTRELHRPTSRWSSFARITSAPTPFRSCANGAMERGKTREPADISKRW